MTDPNGRSGSSDTLRSFPAAAPQKEPEKPADPPAPTESPQPAPPPDRRNVVFERVTPSTQSAPRLVAKEFTIPSGWFRAPKPEGGGAAEAISKAAGDARAGVNRRALIIAMCVAAAVSGVVLALQAPAHKLGRWAGEIPKPSVSVARPAAAPSAPVTTASEPAHSAPIQTAPSSAPSARAASTAARVSKAAPQPVTSARARPPIY